MNKTTTRITTLPFSQSCMGSFCFQCHPIDRPSHIQPLVTLLGAQGDRVRQQGIKTHSLFLSFLETLWTKHQPRIKSKGHLVSVESPFIDAFYVPLILDSMVRPKKKNSCVQVSLPTLILGPTLKMLKFF